MSLNFGLKTSKTGELLKGNGVFKKGKGKHGLF